MRINAIQNNTNSDISFKSLIIKNVKCGFWDPELLTDFVNNKEVRKYVTYFHNKGIDITAKRSIRNSECILLTRGENMSEDVRLELKAPYKKIGYFVK